MARTEEEDERNRCNTARSSKNAAFLRKKKLDSTSREPFRIDSRSWSVITKKDRRKIRGSFIFYVLGEGACGAAFSRAAFKVFLFFLVTGSPKSDTHTHTWPQTLVEKRFISLAALSLRVTHSRPTRRSRTKLVPSR